MPRSVTKASYHHGALRQAVIDAAVAEVEAVGPARLSMREIARRAGVSHAAPAHHFGDKAGIFSAIAAEGFRRMTEAITPTAGSDGFIGGGMAYVRFAIENRGYYEVMFRPDLYRGDDPEVREARTAAFELLFGTARAGLPAGEKRLGDAVAVTGWALAHGFATLWMHANLQDRLGSDLSATPDVLFDGIVALGELTSRQRPPRRRPTKRQ